MLFSTAFMGTINFASGFSELMNKYDILSVYMMLAIQLEPSH
jgi:hypothetical protein